MQPQHVVVINQATNQKFTGIGDKNKENCCGAGCTECLRCLFLCMVCACCWNRQRR